MTKPNCGNFIDDGVGYLAYERTYGRGPSGYEGRLYALKMGARRFPRKLRSIHNRGLDIRDCDVEVADFNIAAHDVEKLAIDIDGSYFKLDNARNYLKNMTYIRKAHAADRKNAIRRYPQFFKRLCDAVC